MGRIVFQSQNTPLLNPISSREFRKVLSPRQRLGVFNAQPSRHVRSQGDQACSRGSSVTWDPRLDT